jgi:transposase-like protein
MTEQRYRAVLEVQAGVPVVEVAERFGVSRQAVHRWLGWYRDEGLAGLSDRSSRPESSPTQTPAEVEAAICELRRAHRRWGARRIEFELGRNGCPGPVPSRITIHRVLIRHGLVVPISRARRSLPNPRTPADLARIRDARVGGPPPQPAAEPIQVQRRVSSRGGLVIAGQRIHIGIGHAGRTMTIESADNTFRIYHDTELVTEVARTTSKNIARFKVRKPEPPRHPVPRPPAATGSSQP